MKGAVIACMVALGVVVGLKEGWWAKAREWIDERVNAA